jgi:hypothetical protein
VQRVAVTPEEAGLCGCWQFIAVWRERQKLRKAQVVEASEEYSFYSSSLALDEYTPQEVAQFIRGHWAACENGAHYRRDVTLGEDASLISGRGAAQAMATLRNLVLGLFELQKDPEKSQVEFLPSWQRRMKATAAIRLIKKGG